MACLSTSKWSEELTETTPSSAPDSLARHYGPLVFKAAYRALGDVAHAEDVAQDVFVRLIEARPQRIDSWPAYLAAAAVRGAIDVLRRRQRWWRLSALLPAPQLLSDSPEALGIEADRARLLRCALGRLSSREAQCFGLRYLQGFELGEIALALRLTENSVHVALHRARKRLEVHLAELQSGEST